MYETRFPVFDGRARNEVETALGEFLGAQGKAEFGAALGYLLNEVIGNSDKANLKRAYFSLTGLDIDDPGDYEKGMKSFRDAIYARQEELVGLVKADQSYVKVSFSVTGGALVLAVANSCPIHPVEMDRINHRLKIARKFQTVQEVMAEGLDQTEGGGFGLIISVLTLRKIGLDERALEFLSTPQGSQVSILVPLNLVNRDQGLVIAQAVVDQVKHIPQFPQHVIQIINTLADPTKSFGHVAGIIDSDPALIADLLRMANSSMYMLPKKVDTIEAAVRVIGMAALRQLVMVSMTEKLLASVYNLKAVKKEMDHAAEVAFYAQALARALKKKEVSDHIFVCAMLHDFGKIIIDALQPGLVEKIGDLCRKKGLNDFVVESLTNGYNHSIVGAELARKWNFPDHIVESIQYHHLPLESSELSRPYVYIVYLANSLYHWARGATNLEDLSRPVLADLGLGAPGALEKLFQSAASGFRTSQAR